MSLKKALYSYDVGVVFGHKTIAIVDEGIGQAVPSVTNTIEDVVAEIAKAENIDDLNQYMIVYNDGDNNWDGWSNEKQDFLLLHQSSLESAVEEYVDYQFVNKINLP